MYVYIYIYTHVQLSNSFEAFLAAALIKVRLFYPWICRYR